MTLQLLPFELSYIWGEFSFLFYQCRAGANKEGTKRAWVSFSLFLAPSLLFIVILLLYYLFPATSLRFWAQSLISLLYIRILSSRHFNKTEEENKRLRRPEISTNHEARNWVVVRGLML